MATVSGKPEDHHRGAESRRRGTPERSPLPVGFAEERIDRRGTEGTEDGHTKRGSPCREEMPKCVGGPPPVCPPLRPPRPPRFNAVQQSRPAGGPSSVCPSSVSRCLGGRSHEASRARAPRPPRARRVARWRFTSGHSAARMLNITLSRTVPSRRAAWWRRTPSRLAPSASIARCERKLKLSVRRPTTLQPTASKAWVRSRSLDAVLTWLRCQRAPYHV